MPFLANTIFIFAKEIMSTNTNPWALNSLAPLAPAEVALTNVSKSFGRGPERVDVLDHINLVATPGEILAILGPSGCGKSTLLRLVASLDTATSGTVSVDNSPVNGIDARCSVVFQEPRLLPWRTDILLLSIITLAILGKTTDFILATLEKRALKWV